MEVVYSGGTPDTLLGLLILVTFHNYYTLLNHHNYLHYLLYALVKAFLLKRACHGGSLFGKNT